MVLLTDGHNNLVKAYNQNTQAFVESFAQLDTRVGAIQLAIDDLVMNSVTTIQKDGRKVVHWEAYQLYYQKILAEQIAAVRSPVSEEKLITPVPQDTSDDDVVFGGDQGTKDGQIVDQAVGT